MYALEDAEGSFPLPVEVLARVLRPLGFKLCLTTCAQVSKHWRAAALSAAAHIYISRDHELLDQGTLTCLGEWLAMHGSCGLTSLHLKAPYPSLDALELHMQLPALQLTNLQSLTLSTMQLLEYPGSSTDADAAAGTAAEQQAEASSQTASHQNPSSSSSVSRPHNPLAALTNLTSLSLDDCTLCGALGDVGGLSTLTNLRRLQLVDERSSDQQLLLRASFGAVLVALTQLTHLTIHARIDDDAAMAALGSLRQLQELELHGGYFGHASSASLAAVLLPASITMLHAAGTIWTDCAASMQQLTGLRHLNLREVGDFNAAVLSSMNQLTLLEVEDYACSYVAALLAALPQLQQLEYLQLKYEPAEDAPEPHLSQFSALLSPSKLVSLCATNSPLPAGAAKHMFAAGRQLPHLRNLVLGYDLESINDQSMPCAFGAGDVCSMVRCCPALRVLELAGAVAPGVQLTALAQLSGLTSLTAGGAAVDDGVAEQVLARLTGLVELEILGADNFTDAGLCQLTRLTGLGMLNVHGSSGITEAVAEDGCELWCKGADNPVWRQLEQLCSDSPTCLRVMLEQRDSELAAEKRLVSTLVQRVASLEQQLAEAQP